MSLRGVDNNSLDSYNRDSDAEPPNDWEQESPAESQELRWVNERYGEVLFVESERDKGSPYAVFVAESMDEVADVMDTGLDNLDEAEVESVKIMEDIEDSRGDE